MVNTIETFHQVFVYWLVNRWTEIKNSIKNVAKVESRSISNSLNKI